MPEKHHIEKNTVQETLIIPLYARKRCTELFSQLYRDDTAAWLMERIDYDFAEYAEKTKGVFYEFGFLEVAMRQTDLAWEVADYLRDHPCAAVVNLGCGLDGTGRACDNGSCRIYNIDLPDVIELRDALLPAREREKNISADLRDTSWFDQIDASGGALLRRSAGVRRLR